MSKRSKRARFYREQRIARASDRVWRGWRHANLVALNQLSVDLLAYGRCLHHMDDDGNVVRIDPSGAT